MSARIPVQAMTTAARGYDVIVHAGALNDIASHLSVAAPAAAYAVITPDALDQSHGARILGILRAAGLTAHVITFPDGETHKTRASWAALTDRMLELNFGRDTCVLALGGGVTGDLAGFVAATYMRGIPFVQLPTTLLAMIDASVGGKTGVDTPAGKNLAGAFHAPHLVIIDPAELRTLPAAELRSGLAEAVKHGAILDAKYFAWIGSRADDVLALDPHALEQLITRSVELKAQVVSADPLESGLRAVLNFGHTIAHALERVTGYGIAHGYAVAAGMCAEAVLGEAVGVTEPGTARDIAQLLQRLGLPRHTESDVDALLRAMRLDKKAREAEPRFVLLRCIGECARSADGGWTHAVDNDTVKRVLRSTVSAPGYV